MAWSGNNYFDCTPFLVYMLEREANALGYAYLPNNLGEYLPFVDSEAAANVKSKSECDAIIKDIMEFIASVKEDLDNNLKRSNTLHHESAERHQNKIADR